MVSQMEMRETHLARCRPLPCRDGDSLCDALLQLKDGLGGGEPAKPPWGTRHAGDFEHLIQQLQAPLDDVLVVGDQDGRDLLPIQVGQQQPVRLHYRRFSIAQLRLVLVISKRIIQQD